MVKKVFELNSIEDNKLYESSFRVTHTTILRTSSVYLSVWGLL